MGESYRKKHITDLYTGLDFTYISESEGVFFKILLIFLVRTYVHIFYFVLEIIKI